MSPPLITMGDNEEPVQEQPDQNSPAVTGKHVIIHLTTMNLELKDGTTTLQTIPLVSQGKPGSYYETIGGLHPTDYKIPLHFSSIGHVYMPYSVHLFGNYFIHGIPYYPNGEKVSSAYSGGCIRLADDDAKILYAFVERGTPIIITRGTDNDFLPTLPVTSTITSMDMTNTMVAAISLEALTQDNEILNTDETTMTTRRKLLPELLTQGDVRVSHLYANSIGKENFINLMNQKAKALGLTSTTFTNLDDPVTTSQEDLERFTSYISTYKSYINKVGNK